MQSLEIISVNLWQILISLGNLLLLYWILKKLLYKPVKKLLAQREEALKSRFDAADEAEAAAREHQQSWEEKMRSAESDAESILKDAADKAEKRSASILEDAGFRAGQILTQAQADAELERKKARAEIRQEVVEVSTALSEKLLGREIRPEDHRELIGSFLDEIGEDDDGNK